MNYLRFTQYAYLLAGILFAVDAFIKWQSQPQGSYIISAVFAVVCIFLFFFRRKFAKKFDDHNKRT